jgi:hypothetical protein
MKIHVTNEDIKYAKTQDRWACAIVRAIQREHPDALFVRADTEVIAFSEGGHRYTYSTPQKAIEKIIEPFDKHERVYPATFSLLTPTVRQVQRITPERKRQLRMIERNRSEQEKEAERTRSAFA